MMKEVFHCTPAELALLDHGQVMLHWEIREAIRREEEKQAKKNKPRYNTGRGPRS